MKISSAITTIILGLFILSGCASLKAPSNPASLTSQKWMLVSAGATDAGSSGAYIEFGNAGFLYQLLIN